MHPKHNLLQHAPTAIMHMIMHPQPRRQRNRHGSKANAASQRKQVFKDWDGFGEDEGNDGEAKGAGEPGYPVYHGVGLEVWRVAEYADENVFCGYVEVEAGADDETGEGDAVAYHLDGLTCALWRLSVIDGNMLELGGLTPKEGEATHLPHQR